MIKDIQFQSKPSDKPGDTLVSYLAIILSIIFEIARMRIMHIRMQQPLFEAWIINVVLRAPG
jgi:hypothetical protein